MQYNSSDSSLIEGGIDIADLCKSAKQAKHMLSFKFQGFCRLPGVCKPWLRITSAEFACFLHFSLVI